VGVVDSIRIFLPLLKSGKGKKIIPDIFSNEFWDIIHTHHIRTGRIINVGSLAGGHNDPEPGLSIYSGTKHAVEGLSEALRFELARVGVDVSLIQPDGSFLDRCLFDQHHK
jgi:short-subunit dehydrogenase